MLGFRPKSSELYLLRQRLLQRLPDSPGYVIWLEAPYGYGKSVLSSQWAETLEADGWRVLWLSVQGRDLKAALASLVDLPTETLWGSILDAVWQQPSLLVLEDLEGFEDINLVLKDARGLTLLASRGALRAQELPRVQTQGRLIHLVSRDLAFTPEEARSLFKNPKQAEVAWQESQGWSLPLHFAALTGEMPDPESLLEGIEDSVSNQGWQEALLLSALPYLPYDCTTPHSHELAKAGFAKMLEVGLRLHPLAAETLQSNHQAEVQQTLTANLERLPDNLKAVALAATGLSKELAGLIEQNRHLANENPEAFLYWHSLCNNTPGPERLLGVAWALSTLGTNDEALLRLEDVLGHCEALDEQKLTALGWYLTILSPTEDVHARELVVEAQRFLHVNSQRVANFFINASVFYYKKQDWEQLEDLQQQALDYLKNDPNAKENEAIVRLNLAEARWERHGDISSFITQAENSAKVQSDSNLYNVVFIHYRLGVSKSLLCDPTATEHFDKAEGLAKHNQREALLARAEKAAHAGNAKPFPQFAREIEVWADSDADAVERIYTLWARVLRKQERFTEALEILSTRTGLALDGERALNLYGLGKKKEALSILPDTKESKQRLTRLELQAAKYVLTRKASDLEELIHLTTSKEAVLPALLPLSSLPKQRPELSKVYPLADVLNSGWKEAIGLRHREIPNLEISLLGKISPTMMGKEVSLSSRQRELLTLLVLGKTRDDIGEALWPESDINKMRNNLDVQLNLLRKILEPWSLKTYITEDGLARTTTDIEYLREALEQNNVKTVLQLYQEPLAPGVDLALLDEVRESLREEVITCLFEAAQESSDGVVYLERLLELDPLHEEALQLLMEKLISRGRKREAIKRYQNFASKLKTEIGLEPLEETRALLGLPD